MKMSKKAPSRRISRIGRPLSFDRDAALHQAMLLFWRHGYEATSLNDLTRSMGVTPPSIYAAFGDKKQLFREAVQRYCAGPITAKSIIEQANTAREATWSLLTSSAIGFTGTDTPPGCLLASSTISCSAAASDVQAELASIRRKIETQLKNKIARDVAMGAMSSASDASAVAAHVMAVIQGMSTLARDGAKREKLMRIALAAMQGWPDSN